MPEYPQKRVRKSRPTTNVPAPKKPLPEPKNAEPSEQTSSSKSQAIPLIATGVICFVGAICITLLIVLLTRDNNDSSSAKLPGAGEGGRTANQVEGEIESIEQQLQDIESAYDDAKQRRDTLERNSSELEEQKRPLEQNIRDLTSQVETIRQFQQATFVMVNPTDFAVGIGYRSGEGYRVVARAEGPLANLASSVAYRNKIRRIASDRELTRRIYRQVAEGDSLPTSLEEEISQHYGDFRYVPYDPDAKVQMASFKDIESKRYQVGFYDHHDDESLYVYSFQRSDNKPLRIPRSRIEPGTAHVGAPDDLLVASAELEFLDYALLEVAKRLGTDPGRSSHVALAIHPKVDLPETILNDHVTITGTVPLGEMFAIGGQITFQDSLVTYLKKVALRIEDEAYAKLVKLGVRVLEREELSGLLLEHGIRTDKNLEIPLTLEVFGKDAYAVEEYHTYFRTFETRDEYFDYYRHYHAHWKLYGLDLPDEVLFVEVAEAQQPHHVSLNVRLVDAYTTEVLWSAIEERPLYQEVPATRYMLNSGQLAVLNASNLGMQVPGHPLSPGPLSPREAPSSRLVFLESHMDDGARMAVRDLFSSRIDWVDRYALDHATTKTVRSSADVPQDNLLRYMTWSLANAALPSAGQVTRVAEKQVSISYSNPWQPLEPGDKLRVVRGEIAGASHDSHQLPIELTVIEANDSTVRARWDVSSVDVLWQDPAKLQPGDIVYPRNRYHEPLVAIETPVVETPSRERWKLLRLDNPVRRQQMQFTTVKNAEHFGNRIREALTKARVRIVRGTTLQDVLNSRATHIVRAKITPRTEKIFDLWAGVYPANSNKPIKEVKFAAGTDALVKWKP